MRVGLIGAGRRGTSWAQAVRGAAVDGRDLHLAAIADAEPQRAETLAGQMGARAVASTLDLLDAVDLALVCVPVRDRALVVSEALRRGAHVLVLWPPAASVPEVEALGRLAEEAGREVGVAHALPVAPLLAASRPGWTPTLATLEVAAPFAVPPPGAAASPSADWSEAPWPHALAGCCGLLGALARSPIRSIDAEGVRDDKRRLLVLAANLRFRSGLYAHLTLRRADTPRLRLARAGGSSAYADVEVAQDPDARASEVRQLVGAIRLGRPAPHGVPEAADTLRLTERILRRLA